MITRLYILTFSFVFILISSCYTITHPTPCPGLVNLDNCDDVELIVFND